MSKTATRASPFPTPDLHLHHRPELCLPGDHRPWKVPRCAEPGTHLLGISASTYGVGKGLQVVGGLDSNPPPKQQAGQEEPQQKTVEDHSPEAIKLASGVPKAHSE